jgi:hypothetical protein
MVTYILGSQLTSEGKVGDASGVFTLAKPAAGQFGGTVDVEVDSNPFELSDFALTGAYVPDVPATGQATGTTIVSAGLSTTIIWTVSANEVIVMDTEAGLTEPILLDLMKQ